MILFPVVDIITVPVIYIYILISLWIHNILSALFCKPPDKKSPSPEVNIFGDQQQKRELKEEADDEEKNVLTEFVLEPNDETFSECIPLKIALEKDYSWAAMDDTSKQVSELNHLAPTVCHANKV